MTSRYGVACLAALGAALLNASAANGPGRDRNQVPDTTADALPAAPQILEDTPPVTPADDAYHYAAWADGNYDGLYTEWWYFNFHDPFNAVRAAFSYFVTDPDDNYGNAQGRMVAVVYTPRGIVSVMDQYTIFARRVLTRPTCMSEPIRRQSTRVAATTSRERASTAASPGICISLPAASPGSRPTA